MDEIDDFFNISKDFKRVSAPLPRPIIEEAPSTSTQIKRERDEKLDQNKKVRLVLKFALNEIYYIYPKLICS